MAGTGGTTSYSPISLLTGTTLLPPKPATTTAPKPAATVTPKPATTNTLSQMMGSSGTASSSSTKKPATNTLSEMMGSSGSAGSASAKKPTTNTLSQMMGSSGTAKAATTTKAPTADQKKAINSLAGLDAAAAKMPGQSKAAIANQFMQALSAAAKEGKAVPNPAGLTAEEANKYRSQFYTQFYSGQPIQQIVDNTAIPTTNNFNAMFPAIRPSGPQAPLPDLSSPLYQANTYTGTGVTPYLVDFGNGELGVGEGTNTPYMGEAFGTPEPSPFGFYPQRFDVGAPDARGLAAAMSPRQIAQPVAPYGRGIDAIGMPQIDYGNPAALPYGRGVIPGPMPQMDYAAPGNQQITFTPQAVRPGVPSGMPAAPFIPQAVRPGQPSGMPAARQPAAPAGGGYTTDMLNSRGIARYLLSDMMGKQQPAAPAIVAQQQGGGFDLMNFLIGQANADEYNGGVYDLTKVPPIPAPRPVNVAEVTIPLDEMMRRTREEAGLGAGKVPTDPAEFAALVNAGLEGLGAYDPATGRMVIADPNGPVAQAAKQKLLNPKQFDFAGETARDVFAPYIAAATERRIPYPATDVPPDLTSPGNISAQGIGAERGIAAAAPSSAAPVGVASGFVRPEDAVAKFGGPDLGSPYSPMYYTPPDMTRPTGLSYVAATQVPNRMGPGEGNWNLGTDATLAMYNALGQQPPISAETPLMYGIGSGTQAALARSPQATSDLMRTTAPGPAGTTARGVPAFPSISSKQRGEADQIVAQSIPRSPMPAPAPTPAPAPAPAPVAEQDLGPPLFPGEGEEPLSIETAEPVAVGPGPTEKTVTVQTPAGTATAKKYTPGPGQFVGTNGYVYEQSEDGSFKRVGKVPGYTDAELYAAANAGAFRNPNSIPVGGSKTTRKKSTSKADKNASDFNLFQWFDDTRDGVKEFKKRNRNFVRGLFGMEPEDDEDKKADGGMVNRYGNGGIASWITEGSKDAKAIMNPPTRMEQLAASGWSPSMMEGSPSSSSRNSRRASNKASDNNSGSSSTTSGAPAGYTPPTQAQIDALYAPYFQQAVMPPSTYVPGVSGEFNYFPTAVAPVVPGTPTPTTNTAASDWFTKYMNAKNRADKQAAKKIIATGDKTFYSLFHDYRDSLGRRDEPSLDSWLKWYSSQKFATGGAVREPRLVLGHGGPKEDKIPASIDGVQEARLSNGEFVMTAAAVKNAGDGDMELGAKRLMDLNEMLSYGRPAKKLNVENVKGKAR